jgi:predicted metal-dependent hydrolase
MRNTILKTRSGELEYTITNRRRVTKRLHMELDDNGGLVVVAPRHWSKRYINAAMTQNIHHVEKFLARTRGRPLKPLQYIDGEQHLYLGKKYPLAVHNVAGRKSHIEVFDGEIRIDMPGPRPEKIQTALQHWYLCRAREVFNERLTDIAQHTPWAQDKDIPLKFRRMKRTWGNCSAAGVIKLNTHLVKAPLNIIDSVIAHELCHLEEMNHGRAFYTLLESLNADWRGDRARLKSEGFSYLLR